MSVSGSGSHMMLQSRWWPRLQSPEGLTDAEGFTSPEFSLTVAGGLTLCWLLAGGLSFQSGISLHRTA